MSKNFSKHVIALMIAAILMFSCVGTAAAASLEVPQEDETETEAVLEDSRDENTPEESQSEASDQELMYEGGEGNTKIEPTMKETAETEQILTEEQESAQAPEAETEETAKLQAAEETIADRSGSCRRGSSSS